MKAASAGIVNPETDPACGMEVDHDCARSTGRTIVYEHVEYYFCSDNCKKRFDKEPGKYAAR